MNSIILLPALFYAPAVAENHHLPRQQESTDGLSLGFAQNPPWDIPSDQWPVLMASPDFEGEYAIDGFDISGEYPGESMDGWTLSVSVKNIDADGLIDTERGKTVFVGSTLRLNPPEDLVEDAISGDAGTFHAHPSWSISAKRYRLHQPDNRTKLEDDDGSCTNLLTSECIKAWEDAAGDNWGSARSFQLPEGCGLEYSAAERPFGDHFGSWQDEVMFSEASRNIDWYMGSEIQLVASEATGLDDDEMINRVGGYTDMLMITWGYNTSHFEDADLETPKAKLICTKGLFRLNNSDGGGAGSSGSDDSDQNDNGVARTSQVSLAAVIVALVAALLTV